MADKYIKEVEGGAKTIFNNLDALELDDGTSSTYILLTDLIKGSEGVLYNGKVSVTVATNNLTVAIKTTDSNDPSTSSPVGVKINGTVRWITAALNLTLAAGTNWFNSGAAAHATFAQNYFVYLSWRAASSAVVLGFARIPYARVFDGTGVAGFSTTTTAERYGAFSTAPAATDDVVNIGRFTATLSATASFNWSVSTFTAENLLQYPIDESEFMTWAPAPTGFTATVPTNTVYQYKFIGKDILLRYREATNGTSNLTTFAITAPFAALTLTNAVWRALGSGVDNGALLSTAVMAQIISADTSISFFATPTGGGWTNANGKRVAFIEMRYPVA